VSEIVRTDSARELQSIHGARAAVDSRRRPVRGARFDGVLCRRSALVLASVVLMGAVASGVLMRGVASGQPKEAEDSKASVDITIQNAVARVGEKAVIVATITVRDGLEITNSYRHRIIKLAEPDGGVELESQVVRGTIQGGRLVFAVGVTPRRVGTHTVRGLFRFSYHNDREVDIRSARFEATVTATE
jgi:hypothetical protein